MSDIQGTSNADSARRAPRLTTGTYARRGDSQPFVPARATDRAEFSAAARMLAQMKDVPAVREDRVEQVRDRVADPKFDLNAALARAIDKMIDDGQL